MSELNDSRDTATVSDDAATLTCDGKRTNESTIRWPWHEAQQLVVQTRAQAMEAVCRMNVETFAEGGEQGRDEA